MIRLNVGFSRKVGEPGKAAYAFISGEDGCDYYFNEYDVRPEVEFDDISQGDSVAFEVRRDRSGSRAGAAREGRPV